MTDIKLRADKEEGDKDSEIKSLKARYDDFNRTYGYRKMNPLYIYLCAAALSLVWTGIIGYYIANSIYSLSSLLKMLPHEFGGFLAGTIMPVGFIWMIAVYIDRNLNSSYEREVIYPFLQSIIDPHGDASAITNVIKKKMRAETAELKDAIEELSGHSALIENASRSVRSDVSGAVEKMRAHAAALDDIAGGLNKSSNSIDQKTGGILKSVSENIRLLLDTANAAEKKSEGITKSLVAETSRLEDTVEKTSRVVEAISETIVRNRDEIDRSTEAALARAREISAGFDGLGEKILGSVDAIEARADGIIGRIGEKTDSFIIKSNISAEKIADATGRISKAVESAGAISDDNRKMSELALE
ncbi:MAG: hypothetical protein LBO78_01055, partial [Rickettsiales bacterium]|nr:hypothetical protein [Rickettsiales bacterium]